MSQVNVIFQKHEIESNPIYSQLMIEINDLYIQLQCPQKWDSYEQRRYTHTGEALPPGS